MRKTLKKTNQGSVSHGTMRNQDLIPDFLWELNSQTPIKRHHMKLRTETRKFIAKAELDEELWESGEAYELLDELFTALDEYALTGFSFGSSVGDSSDYGYWLCPDFQQYFEGLQVNDLSEVPTDYYGEVLNINDHGNMTLYNRSRNNRLVEIWATV